MADPLPTTAEGWIGYCFAADMAKRLPLAIALFKTWTAADPTNAAAALAARQDDQAVLKRDYVSRARNSYIDAALAS